MSRATSFQEHGWKWLLVLALVAIFAVMGTGCSSSSDDPSPDPMDPMDPMDPTDPTDPTDPAEASPLRVTAVNPGSAGTDSLVEVRYALVEDEGGDGDVQAIDSNDLRVVIGGQTVLPVSVTDEMVTFRVPADLAGDVNLGLQAGALGSNTLRFTVTDSVSVITPAPGDLVVSEDGTEVAVNLVMIFIADGFDLDAVAEAVAVAEGAAVVGRVDPLRARQLQLTTTTLAQLEEAIARILARPDIDDAVMDVVYEPDDLSLDWSLDPVLPGQRAANRVEEGAQAYVDSVHPLREGAITPYFRSIGVFESGIHFSSADYAGYATSGSSRSGGIALYAPDRAGSTSRGSNHGTNVLGLIAAELGDGRAAGLLRALGEKDAHGGFNIRVGNSATTTAHGFMAEIILALESGARVFNMSAGVHKCDTFTAGICTAGILQSNGSVVANNAVTATSFDSWASTYNRVVREMERNYPGAILVVSSGNGNTDAGDLDYRLFSANTSNQVLVAGAHSNAGMPTREAYSNYGERVDIAAAGTVQASRTAGTTSGTSFAAPLVTATIAAMRSIEPNLTPLEVRQILRSTALPIDENTVTLLGTDGTEIGSTVFTRALTAAEVGEEDPRVGKGARLNVEGAILAAIERREARTRRTAAPISIAITGAETVTRTVSVTIPAEGAVFDRVDIMFLVDVSGSYGSSIAEFQSQAVELVQAFEASGTDVHTGIASFSDFPISPWGVSIDYAYQLDQGLTGNAEETIAAINALQLLSGNDFPESQLEALFQLATGAGRTVEANPAAGLEPTVTGWRDGSLRIVFLATDASFHNPEDGTSTTFTPGYAGASWTETVSALNGAGIRVYGLERGFEVPDVRAMVAETGGETFQLDAASSDIVAAVTAALEAASAALDVSLVPNGDFARMIQTIVPAVREDVARGETVTFDITLTRGDAGPGEQVFVFRLEVVGAGTAVIEEIPVVVNLD